MKSLFVTLLLITFCHINWAQVPGRSYYIWDFVGLPLAPQNLLTRDEYRDGLHTIDRLVDKYRKPGTKLTLLWCFKSLNNNKCTFIINGSDGATQCYHFELPSGREISLKKFPVENILSGLAKDSSFFHDNFIPRESNVSFVITWVLYSNDYPNNPLRFIIWDDLDSNRPFANSLEQFILSR